MKKWGLFLVIWISLLSSVAAQEDQLLRYAKSPVRIPFDLVNSFVIVDVSIKGLPLRFIVDTGAEHTILFQKEISDILAIRYDRRVRLMGADMSETVYGYTASNVQLQLGNVGFIQTNFVILEEDFVSLENIIGQKVHGILGANILKNFIVGFNFKLGVMKWSKYDQFKKPPRKYVSMPITLNRGKPYMDCVINTNHKDSIQARLLLDTGASLALLLYANEHNKINIPDQYLTGQMGLGLGGNVVGYLGKIQSLQFGKYRFEQLISNYQKIETLDSSLIRTDRHGIIGNVLLSKFDLIFDYRDSLLHVKPNRFFSQRIQFDKSGLVFIYSGIDLNEIHVLEVLPGSPAEEADIKPGDQLIKFNGLPIRFYSLSKITKRLSAKPDKEIKIQILRDGIKMNKTFKLRSLL
jgi:predicted aspartyl protease